MWFINNTFYKCAYEFGEGHALTLGSGGSGSTPVTNLIVTRNVFIDCGDHSEPTRSLWTPERIGSLRLAQEMVVKCCIVYTAL